MKKRLVIWFLFIITLSTYSFALRSDLLEPANGAILQNTNVTFVCMGAGTGTTNNITLYHNINQNFGPAMVNQTAVTHEQPYNFPELTGISDGEYIWNCLVTGTNNVKKFEDTNFTFTINVSISLISEIPNIIWPEDTINNSIDLDNYFSYPAGVSVTYAHSSVSHVSVSISNGVVTLTPEEDWYGAQQIIFTATYEGISVSDTTTLNITSVNDPPELTEIIPNLTWTMNNEKIIDLDDYFTDVDSDLNYTSTEISKINVSISQVNGEVTFIPEENWTGNASIIFTVSDGEYDITSNNITLKVQEKNTPPTIDTLYPDIDPDIKAGESQTFRITKSDANNDTLTIQWYLDGASITGATSDSYTYISNLPGAYIIKAIVSDGSSIDSYEWILTVQETNLTIGNLEEGPEIIRAEAVCGNRIEEEGENCENCPQDVPCGGDFICVGGRCIKEKKSSILSIVIILSIVVIAVVIFGILYNKKRSAELGLKELPKREKLKPIKKSKEQPVAEIEDFFYREPERKVKPMTEKPKLEKTVGSIILKNYIKNSLNKGLSKEKIKQSLLKTGWDKEKVEEALKEV